MHDRVKKKLYIFIFDR